MEQESLIFIVDDNPTNIKVVADFLKESGLRILVATNGVSCLKKLEKVTPDLILLDVIMPEMDGYETCRRLKESPKTQDIPIIFMTAVSDTDPMDKVKGLSIGAVDYITKPIIREEVLARVQVHLKLRNLTKQLQQSKEIAERANKAKTDFLAHMSHELRTPLTGVLGYAQLLQIAENLTIDQQNYTDAIYQCGSHLLSLIDELLDIARIEARQLELYPSELQFSSFLKGVLQICFVRAKEKDIKLIYQRLSELPDTIKADEKRLRQILINLIGNAIKFTDKGKVIFKVGVLKKNNSENVQTLRFQVEDTGVGMTSEELEKIFFPFVQVGEAQRRKQGAGLGLAISQTITKLMGSELKVRSKPGIGSVFWFDVNFSVISPSSLLNQNLEIGIIDVELANKLPLKILIADDSSINQMVALHMLKQLGYDADVANNGKEVLEKLQTQTYDLIFMDLMMPQLNGLDTTRYICQAFDSTSRPLIVAMTANSIENERELCVAAGMNHYISKPFIFEELIQVLYEAGGRN